jgi:hypothetical protein
MSLFIQLFATAFCFSISSMFLIDIGPNNQSLNNSTDSLIVGSITQSNCTQWGHENLTMRIKRSFGNA